MCVIFCSDCCLFLCFELDIANSRNTERWKLELLVSNVFAVPSGSQELVSSCFVLVFFPALKDTSLHKCLSASKFAFAITHNPVFFPTLYRSAQMQSVFNAANTFGVPGIVSPGLFDS